MGTVFSSSEASLSAELKPSFPEDSNGSTDYADRVDLKGTEFEKYEEFEFLKLPHGDTPLQNLKKIREQASVGVSLD